MVDPVVAPAVAPQMAEQAMNAVKHASGGTIGRVLMAPINIVSGLGKGVFGSLTNFSGLLMSGVAFFGLGKFAPDAMAWLLSKVSGKPVDEMKEELIKGGTGAQVKYALMGGALTNAAIGGASGMVSEVAGGADGQESSTFSKVAGFAGGALAIAGVAAVTMGAVHRSGIEFKGDADKDTPKTPDALPNKQENTVTNQKS